MSLSRYLKDRVEEISVVISTNNVNEFKKQLKGFKKDDAVFSAIAKKIIANLHSNLRGIIKTFFTDDRILFSIRFSIIKAICEQGLYELIDAILPKNSIVYLTKHNELIEHTLACFVSGSQSNEELDTDTAINLFHTIITLLPKTGLSEELRAKYNTSQRGALVIAEIDSLNSQNMPSEISPQMEQKEEKDGKEDKDIILADITNQTSRKRSMMSFFAKSPNLLSPPPSQGIPKKIKPTAVPLPISSTAMLTMLAKGQVESFEEKWHAIHDKEAKLDKDDPTMVHKLAQLMLDLSLQGLWVIKNNGKVEATYADRDKILNLNYKRNADILLSAEKLFKLLDKQQFDALCDADEQHLNREKLENWHNKQIENNGVFYGYDDSEDSDSEDEEKYRTGVEPRYQRLRDIAEQHKPDFWRRTRRNNTGGIGSFEHKAKQYLANPTSNHFKQVNDAIEVKRERAQIEIDSSNPNKYVATYRGINYFPDRWSNFSKRQHYKTIEVNVTQYAESALMVAGDMYGGSSQPLSLNDLQKAEGAAIKIQANMASFANTGACVAYTVKPSIKPYLFNSYADYLQHLYSNGISQHLLGLASHLAEAKNDWLCNKFINGYNYAISTGERPDHSMRYAIGLKNYYQFAVEPRYNQDGSIANFHAGKLHIYLFPLDLFLNPAKAHRVTKLLLNGAVPIENNIASEIETTFIGKVDAQHVVYEFPLRYPNFSKKYKSIYEIKYGLDEPLFQFFRTLISESTPFSKKRKNTIQLLKNWLCAYYEVLAISMAQKLSNDRHGSLTYVDTDDNLIDMPPLRPLTKGHQDTQNIVHVLRNTRWELGEEIVNSYAEEEKHTLAEGEVLFHHLNTNKTLDNICKSDDYLDNIIQKESAIKLSPEVTSKVLGDAKAESEARRNVARTILQDSKHLFFSKSLSNATPKVKLIAAPQKKEADGFKNIVEQELPLHRL